MNWGEQGRHIKRAEAFPNCQSDVFDLFHKVFGAIDVVWGLDNQRFEDFGNLKRQVNNNNTQPN